ncbi:unnamed protein product [Zymoseptoria tritici ST99CH_1A5]|uniref:Kinesin-like protein n=1 Tax=Zymoseptoria tritici ST99CH_1A5 TaxID=1276529 RepID=A0A1Y6M2K9_ZYMTR|nr:unnamed protein product [Zymoseptoria tritici ST99CH_1A5]
MATGALSSKTYQFDKVFSPAADQGMVFEEVVKPVLDEVLSGFNCTIFAYGQTGTGKTYTMTGDMTEVVPAPEAAGIIPRVFHSLFERLGEESAEACEYSVKCSFVELYNEELRDLLATDDNVKLKIFDEANRNGRTTTLVQGMEERHIKNASKGIQLLRAGSHKRQVAATQCNDLSSRSHTVFTITVYVKQASDTGHELVSAGKLNLVDLAGSENIQRSGAENKRAAEAGLINKSLLTLGRVINALVEKSSHIPYRESKLTRLLQDSLGGRTKTCIIATLSPAKSNVDETISTLDYAFRAKNIRNKPQVSQVVSKKILLAEFTTEIERLKSELIATRQRNGVHLTPETYEQITTESESRRILVDEQSDKIVTMESNLRNKVQELFVLGTSFNSLKKDNERTRESLADAKTVLEQTEIVLAHTRQNLGEESQLRKAHQQSEERLAGIGEALIETLNTTNDHTNRLHSKLRRRSDLQSINREKWKVSQAHIAETTLGVCGQIGTLRDQQEKLIGSLTNRVRCFVETELHKLRASQVFVQTEEVAFKNSESDMNAQTCRVREDMNHVLDDIGTLQKDVKQRVRLSLNDLSTAAQHMINGLVAGLDSFRDQIEHSYNSLEQESIGVFDDLVNKMNEQQAEVDKLRQQVALANAKYLDSRKAFHQQLEYELENEKKTAASERAALLGKITQIVNESAAAQEIRMDQYVGNANKRIKASEDQYHCAQSCYGSGMDAWNRDARITIDSAIGVKEKVANKIRSDWTTAQAQVGKLARDTTAIRAETTRIVNDQMQQIEHQTNGLDQILSRVRVQHNEREVAQAAAIGQLASKVQDSYLSIGQHLENSCERLKVLDDDVREGAGALSETLPVLDKGGDLCQALGLLRDHIQSSQICEYIVTGDTPERLRYSFPAVLPRTEAHTTLLNRMRSLAALPSEGPFQQASFIQSGE